MKKKSIGIMIGLLLLMIGTSNKTNIMGAFAQGQKSIVEYICRNTCYASCGNLLTYDKEKKWYEDFFVGTGKSVLDYEQLMLTEESPEERARDLAEQENSRQRCLQEDFIVKRKGKVEKKKKEDTAQETIFMQGKKSGQNALVEQLKANLDTEFLLDNFYIVDSTTSVDRSLFDVKKMLETSYSIEKKEEPQILIFHTHGGSEYFSDGKKKEASVIAVGTYLQEILEEKYGYSVIHDTTKYDCINGKLDRNKAYNQALDGIKKQMKEAPSIQVVIDLHRDGGNTKERRVTELDGQSVAQFMIFNGLSRNRSGEIKYLYNSKLQDNLAFGLQMKLRAMELYPNLTIRNYLKGYRYNMHLCKRFLLIELGNQNNTVEEARNTMPYLAEILNDVLQGEGKKD